MKLAAGIVMAVALAGCPDLLFAAQSGRLAAPVPAPTAQAEVSFQFEREGLPVPRFTLRIREDGMGSYQAEEAEGRSDGGEIRYASAKHIDRTMSLSPATVARIFKAVRELSRPDMNCDSKTKNIANMGKKTLNYTGAEGASSCVYNYSDNKDVMMLTSTFLAIAYTMDEGRKLEYLHRYDRLGLDAETIELEKAVENGRAVEIGTIEPVLTSIAGDMTVMQRARLRVVRLLEQSKSSKTGRS
ncbi:MAG: hypothetical protein ABI380_05115 [Edaphobacter sp.]